MNQEVIDKKNEIELEIAKNKIKRNKAAKISYRANKKKENWIRLSFPINNEKFDKILLSLSIASLFTGLFAGGLIFKGNGQDPVNGMLVGSVTGWASSPLGCLVVGGARRATQLIADKFLAKYKLKEKELIAQSNELSRTEDAKQTNAEQTKTAESNSQEI